MTAQYVGHEYGTSGTLDFSALAADGDALILHFRSATDGPVGPAGWEQIIGSLGTKHFVGYRTWQTGDPTTEAVLGTNMAVSVYRNVDVAYDGVTAGDAPVVSRAAGGYAEIVNPDDLAIDFATHVTDPSFAYGPPPGETPRYGTGIALADTAGQTLTPTVTWQGVFTPSSATYLATVVLKTLPAPAGGWGVGQIRMGAN